MRSLVRSAGGAGAIQVDAAVVVDLVTKSNNLQRSLRNDARRDNGSYETERIALINRSQEIR